MTILVATDFSENTATATRYAALIARTLGLPLRVLHVVDFSGDDNAWRILYETTDEIEKHARDEATQRLKTVFNGLVSRDERPTHIDFAVRFGTPAEGILAECETRRPDLIVAGTVGESRLQHLFFGRTTNHLVRETDIPVLAVPPEIDVKPFKRILVAIDFSTCAELAATTAVEWARGFGATIEAIHAVDVDSEVSGISFGHILGDVSDKLESLRDERLDALKAMLESKNIASDVSEIHIVDGRPDQAISELGESGFDLIAMGTHGRTGFARWFLGSTAERVLRAAQTPVLVLSNP